MKKFSLLFVFLSLLLLASCGCSEISDNSPQPLDVTSFEVFLENGHSIGTFENLFEAIDRTHRRENAIVVDGENQTVFRRNEPGAVFLFQHTQYIKTVYSEWEAEEFLKNTPYTHAILSNGTILGANYEFFTYDDSYELGGWRIEPFSGGYIYKVSYIHNSFRRATTVVELSQARLRKSDCSHGANPTGFNAYIFFALQNQDVTFDAGIYNGWANDGEWRVFVATTWGELVDYGLIVESDYIDGKWIPRHDVEIDYQYTEGAMTLRVTNLGTGQTIEVNYDHPFIGEDSAFIKGTAFVPDLRPNQMPNWRNSGYLLNVVYRDAYLHRRRGLDTWDSVPFWLGNRETTQYLLRYNTDTCTIEFIRNEDGNVVGEIINIDYRFR
ncbi:MAG: hypothetical protein FWE06_03370 [Oscillospiraceae bacterium]|nr:hypothetical protein [Oscillospiraceae bacterium]